MFLLRISSIHTCTFSQRCFIAAAVSLVNQSQNRFFSGKSELAILPPQDLAELLENYQGFRFLTKAAQLPRSLQLCHHKNGSINATVIQC